MSFFLLDICSPEYSTCVDVPAEVHDLLCLLLAEFLQLVWRDERVIRVDDLVIGFVPLGCGLSGGPGLDG